MNGHACIDLTNQTISTHSGPGISFPASFELNVVAMRCFGATIGRREGSS
jgi:hypothetical protein